MSVFRVFPYFFRFGKCYVRSPAYSIRNDYPFIIYTSCYDRLFWLLLMRFINSVARFYSTFVSIFQCLTIVEKKNYLIAFVTFLVDSIQIVSNQIISPLVYIRLSQWNSNIPHSWVLQHKWNKTKKNHLKIISQPLKT